MKTLEGPRVTYFLKRSREVSEQSMKNRDIFSSLLWIAVGILFLVGALQQGLIRKGLPGPGFLPFLTAIVFIFLSLLVLGAALRKRRKASGAEKKIEFFPERDSWKKILLAIFALFAYGVSLGYAGYILTTFLFMLFVMKFVEPQSWKTTFLIAVATVISTYMLFVVLLEVRLPRGVFEF
jgi:putative tricarboxylic transport membrane protein